MSDTNELLEEMAEAIAGKYHTPSEGTHDDARRMLLIVTDWMKHQGPDHKRVAAQIESDMKAKPIRSLMKREDDCGN